MARKRRQMADPDPKYAHMGAYTPLTIMLYLFMVGMLLLGVVADLID